MNRQTIPEIELNLLAPELCWAIRFAKVRCFQDWGLLGSKHIAVEAEFQNSVSNKHTVDVSQVLLQFSNSASNRNVENIL
ncbi:hypothetical protein ATO13_07715 [Stappia sp. 22II-S9-Z10]|nr:hypothetical protein ATO13_07715 [Stappia sp. 22II-S9-Z10]